MGFRSKVSRDGLDGVTTPVSKLLLHGVNALVNIDHESVEVHASLACNMWGKRSIEKIHEHGFASANISIQV